MSTIGARYVGGLDATIGTDRMLGRGYYVTLERHVTPAREQLRRDAVPTLQRKFSVSERRACGVLDQPRVLAQLND